jgi:hypothetical protein
VVAAAVGIRGSKVFAPRTQTCVTTSAGRSLSF